MKKETLYVGTTEEANKLVIQLKTTESKDEKTKLGRKLSESCWTGIGPEYAEDDAFKKKARYHQAMYRVSKLGINRCMGYGIELHKDDYFDADGKANIFYKALDEICQKEALKRYPNKTNERVYGNLLRSQHIPFNLFAPLMYDYAYFVKVLNSLLPLSEPLSSVDNVIIEWAPSSKPGCWYLADATSFDTYVEYHTVSNKKGCIGIEIKYTEQGYLLKPAKDKTQRRGEYESVTKINYNSLYYLVTKDCGLYQSQFVEDLLNGYEKGDAEMYNKKGGINQWVQSKDLMCNDIRQIWRNHILGESMRLAGDCDIFTSVLIYPEGNTHFHGTSDGIGTIQRYKNLLNNDKKDSFVGITYEQFFDSLEKYCPDKDKYADWITYLRERYIVPID